MPLNSGTFADLGSLKKKKKKKKKSIYKTQNRVRRDYSKSIHAQTHTHTHTLTHTNKTKQKAPTHAPLPPPPPHTQTHTHTHTHPSSPPPHKHTHAHIHPHPPPPSTSTTTHNEPLAFKAELLAHLGLISPSICRLRGLADTLRRSIFPEAFRSTVAVPLTFRDSGNPLDVGTVISVFRNSCYKRNRRLDA